MAVASVGLWVVAAVALVALSASGSVKGEGQFCGAIAFGRRSTDERCGEGECCNGHRCGKSDDHCNRGKGCDDRYGECNDPDEGGCFPGDAVVRIRGNNRKPISELRIGDEVATWDSKGQLKYKPIYAQGHRDTQILVTFVSITLKSIGANVTRTLQLTYDHFVMVVKGNNKIGYKRAKDINIGDMIMAMDDNFHVSTFMVSDVQGQLLHGLYNPITTSGTIIVNDVIASCYSHWFLDSFFDQLGLPELIPSAYQVILYPARLLYRLIGEKAYITLYDRMCPHVEISKSVKDLKSFFHLLLMSLEYLHQLTKEAI